MKKQYIDETIPPEGENIPAGASPEGQPPMVENILNYTKSNFGSNDVLPLVIVILILCLLYYFKEDIVNWLKNKRIIKQ